MNNNSMDKKNFRIFLGANILWFLIIFILCALPGDDIPDPHLDIPHLDKVVHFGMFFIFSLLLVYPLERNTSLPLMLIFSIAVGVAFVYGGLLEILQYYFFNRSGDVWDLFADVLGGIGGCLCYPTIKRIFCR